MAGYKAGKLKETITKKFYKRSFLYRLLVTTLVAALIPVSIISFRMVQNEQRNVILSAEKQLQNVAVSAALQFDRFVANIEAIRNKFAITPIFYRNSMTDSVQNEKNALETIKYYYEMLPFASSLTLYDCVNDQAYTNTGKFHRNGFCRMVLNCSSEDFDAMLEERKSMPGFIPWDKTPGYAVYVAPVPYTMQQQYILVTFTKDSFTKAMESILAGQYFIADICDENGNVIYQNESAGNAVANSGEYFSATQKSNKKYSIRLFGSAGEYQTNVGSITQTSRSIAILNVILCLLLIGIVVIINYRPLAKLVKLFDEQPEEPASELDKIMNGYQHLISEKGHLTMQLYEKEMMIRDKLLEKLLLGQKLSDNDYELLDFRYPYYRIACVALKDIRDSLSIIERNQQDSSIHAIEMYASNQLVFLCGQSEKTEKALEMLVETLRAIIGSEDIPIGFSDAAENPRGLSVSYSEAYRALSASGDSPNRFLIKAGEEGEEAAGLRLNDEGIFSKLTSALKTGNSFVLDYAETAFTEIMDSYLPKDEQRYACFHLIDCYRRACEALNIHADLSRLSSILAETNIFVMKNRFMDYLDQLRQAQAEIQQKETIHAENALMNYIDENFTDPQFCLNSVADYLGVTIYTASRVLKSVINDNFRQYLNDRRIELAKKLLAETDLSVKEIAEKVGFASSSHFIKTFKATLGLTPGNYRAEAAGKGSEPTAQENDQ